MLFSEMSAGHDVPRDVFVDLERGCLMKWARGPVAVFAIRSR
jgi:hypothetical protein